MKLLNKLKKELSYQAGIYLIPPEYVSLIITTACNFRCPACAIWQNPVSNELNQEQWRKIIAYLSAELPPQTFVEINGGEPLLKPELALFLISQLKKHFLKMTLNTNGFLLDDKMVNDLKQAGLDTLKISLYSLEPAIHNTLRGNDLAHEKAMQACKLVNQAGLNLEIALLITGKNINSAKELIEYFKDWKNTKIIIQPLDERVESAEAKNLNTTVLPQPLWPDKDSVNQFFPWLLNHLNLIKNSPASLKAMWQYYLDTQSSLKYRCFAGIRNLVVYPDGTAAFCFKTPSIGNLLDKPLKQILRNSNTARKKLYFCSKYCRIVGCNFSRGIKEYIFR